MFDEDLPEGVVECSHCKQRFSEDGGDVLVTDDFALCAACNARD